jgi:hypothetical protein
MPPTIQNPPKKMIDFAHQPVGVQERGRVKKLGTSVEVRVCALILFFALMPMRSAAQTNSETVEKGSFKLHSLLHAIGEETYEVKRTGSDELVMNVSSELTDRSNKRSIAATLRMRTDLTPSGFSQDRNGARATPIAATPGQTARLAASAGIDSVEFASGTATVHEGEASRAITPAAKFFVGFGASPVSVQMMMVRYWSSHGKPTGLEILRAVPGAPDVEIESVGTDNINVDGRAVALTRYTVANIVFGREILWMNAQGQLAALMTFAGGLPFEAVRTEYEPALNELFHAGVAQEMRDCGRNFGGWNGTSADVEFSSDREGWKDCCSGPPKGNRNPRRHGDYKCARTDAFTGTVGNARPFFRGGIWSCVAGCRNYYGARLRWRI